MTSEMRLRASLAVSLATIGSLATISSLAGCEWGGGPGPGPSLLVSDARGVDAPKVFHDAPSTIDSPMMIDASTTIDAPVNPSGHLLLTEIAVTPDGAEFIEVYNPTTAAVDLTHYYLSNHGSYFKLPVAGQSLPLAHFIVQFPAGASIAPGAVAVIATQGAAPFNTFYGTNPTYSITDATMINTAVSGTPRLTDGGALVVLFQWDGTSGLVKDVDIMIVGAPSLTNVLVDKSGVTQNGSTYAADTDAIPPQASAPGISQSTKRIKAESGQELQNGTGNGLTGHDETSEHTDVTWDSTFTAPTPGVAPTL